MRTWSVITLYSQSNNFKYFHIFQLALKNSTNTNCLKFQSQNKLVIPFLLRRTQALPQISIWHHPCGWLLMEVLLGWIINNHPTWNCWYEQPFCYVSGGQHSFFNWSVDFFNKTIGVWMLFVFLSCLRFVSCLCSWLCAS